MTFADLSNVQSTTDLINEIIDYSIKNPHFLNQIAWLHASKAISQKWPCIIKKLNIKIVCFINLILNYSYNLLYLKYE